MSEQSGSPAVHSLLGWLVAGGAALVASILGLFRWTVRTIAGEVIAEHNRDDNAHQVAADKRHEAIQDDLDRLTSLVTQMHEDVALLIQSHNQAVKSGTCPALVPARRASDPSDADMTPLRANGGHRGRQ